MQCCNFISDHTCVIELALKAVSKVALITSASKWTTIICAAGDLMAVILVPTAFIQICSRWKKNYIFIRINKSKCVLLGRLSSILCIPKLIHHILPFLQVYWWQSLHFTSFHSYLYSTPSVCTQSSSRKLFGWFLAQAVKFPVPRSAQVKEPSVKISFNPSQDFAPLWRCCKNTFSSLFWTSTRTEFSCRHLSSAVVQFWQVLLVK